MPNAENIPLPVWESIFPSVSEADAYANCRFFLESAITDVVLSCGLVPKAIKREWLVCRDVPWLDDDLAVLCDMLLPGRLTEKELLLLERLQRETPTMGLSSVVNAMPLFSSPHRVELPDDLSFYKELTRTLEQLARAWKLERGQDGISCCTEEETHLTLSRAKVKYMELLSLSGVEGKLEAMLAGVPEEDIC